MLLVMRVGGGKTSLQWNLQLAEYPAMEMHFLGERCLWMKTEDFLVGGKKELKGSHWPAA